MNDEARSFPAVFSDVDETIIAAKSLFEFARELVNALPEAQGNALAIALGEIAGAMKDGAPRGELNRRFYSQVLGGRSVDLVERVARDWYRRAALRGDAFFKPGVSRFIKGAQQLGARLVLVSGSFPALVEPVAARYAAADMLVTPVEKSLGQYTGNFPGLPLIGQGKEIAVRAYAAQHRLMLEHCAGIGDDLTDIPFLSLLGYPHVPADAQVDLLSHATAAGWSVIAA